jgi:hypothetical protein
MQKRNVLIAAGVAAILAAPVSSALAADVKFSGRVALDLVFEDEVESTRSLSDNGTARFQIDASQEAGDLVMFGRIALDMRDRVKSDGQTRFGPEYRDRYIGIKGGFGSLQAGRMAGALKNAEKDPYITTFLQARNTIAVAGGKYGSNSFVDDLLQYSYDFGAVGMMIQYNPTTDSAGDSVNDAAVMFTGKLGGFDLWAGWNNAGDSDNDNVKVGARTKFGEFAVTAQYEMRDGWVSGSAANLFGDRVFLMGDLPFANGYSGNAAFGSNLDSDDTWYRLAMTKALAKNAKAYTGVTFTSADVGEDETLFGVGAELRF